MSMQTLDELARETDSLTYLNALKVTLTEIKDEFSEQEALREHQNRSAERTKRLMRKADAQYRLFARIVNKESPFISDVTVDTTEIPEDIKEVMESD